MFADKCVLYHQIKTTEDARALQLTKMGKGLANGLSSSKVPDSSQYQEEKTYENLSDNNVIFMDT